MRLVYILAALVAAAFVFAGRARAADTPQFVLRPDGTVEQRVAKVEGDVEKLTARIADLERQLGNVTAPPAKSAASAAPAKVRYSVCVNGRCTVYEADAGSPIPAGATVLSGWSGVSVPASASPCPTGGCGDACGCVGVSSSSSSSGRRSGWYPGKLLGR